MSAIFILSTGRCGTQWLSKQLAQAAPDHWRVEHEPLHLAYAPQHNSPGQPLAHNREILVQHLATIRQHLNAGGVYLECGFPCWRHLQWFLGELDVNVKVIHLHRHPIATARSWLKQNSFVPPILPHLPVKELFHPAAPGALLPEYLERWPALSPFEKNLYYWAEVNLQALAYREVWEPLHWVALRFEDMIQPATIKALLAFVELTTSADSWNPEAEDRYGGLEQAPVDEALLNHHQKILQLTARLGY